MLQIRSKLLTTIGILALACVFPARSDAVFANLAVLGDSLSDQGRLFDITDLPLIGGIPPSETYFNGRFSNGPVWVDHFKTQNPSVGVFNLAMGGALSGIYSGYDNVGDFDFESIPIIGGGLAASAIGLRAQVASVPNVTGADVAFAMFIGANDFISSAEIGYASAVDAVPAVVSNLKSALKELVRPGGDQFVLFNLPDLGKTPRAIADGREAELSQATTLFNQTIDDLVVIGNDFGLDVEFVDSYSLLDAIFANPANFGFSDVTSTCVDGLLDQTLCGDPGTARLFWDPLHPTTAAHALFAEQFAAATGFAAAAAVTAVPLPGAVWLLIPALAGIARMRRCQRR